MDAIVAATSFVVLLLDWMALVVNAVGSMIHDSGVLQSSTAARRFGEALVLLGIGILAIGLVYHSPS